MSWGSKRLTRRPLHRPTAGISRRTRRWAALLSPPLYPPTRSHNGPVESASVWTFPHDFSCRTWKYSTWQRGRVDKSLFVASQSRGEQCSEPSTVLPLCPSEPRCNSAPAPTPRLQDYTGRRRRGRRAWRSGHVCRSLQETVTRWRFYWELETPPQGGYKAVNGKNKQENNYGR